MSVETFRRNIAAGLARQRREQRQRAWSLVAGLIAAIPALGLSGALADIGVPDGADQWLYLFWVIGAWFGTGSLLAFGVVAEPSARVLPYMRAGLWAGAVAVAVGVVMAPLALILLLLPIGAGGSIVRRNNGNRYAALYVALPLIALLASVAYQSLEASGIWQGAGHLGHRIVVSVTQQGAAVDV